MPRSAVGWLAGDADILDPRSRHNLHVTRPDDLEAVGGWSRETLYAAVRFADGEDAVVVLDHDRAALYIADGSDLTYDSPRRLGFAAPPALHVAAPRRFHPEQSAATAIDPVAVSPAFDLLVPAFDWEDLDEDDLLPPPGVRPSRSPIGAGSGTPG